MNTDKVTSALRIGLERCAAILYPRRCPFCGELLSDDSPFAAVCQGCLKTEMRLRHAPPRLPETEHTFQDLSAAYGGYYYADEMRHAILLCKQYGNVWYAREMADLLAVRVFGADVAKAPGTRPYYRNLSGFPLFSCIVPVPPKPGGSVRENLPYLLADRLGKVLQIPVRTVIVMKRRTKAQKNLSKEDRFRNVRNAYIVKPGIDLTGKRILLLDDVITTGATISACAHALQQAGASQVAALCLAADELLPKEKQTVPTKPQRLKSDRRATRP